MESGGIYPRISPRLCETHKNKGYDIVSLLITFCDWNWITVTFEEKRLRMPGIYLEEKLIIPLLILRPAINHYVSLCYDPTATTQNSDIAYHREWPMLLKQKWCDCEMPIRHPEVETKLAAKKGKAGVWEKV